MDMFKRHKQAPPEPGDSSGEAAISNRCLVLSIFALLKCILVWLDSGGLVTSLRVSRGWRTAALECKTSDWEDFLWWPAIAHGVQPLSRKLASVKTWWRQSYAGSGGSLETVELEPIPKHILPCDIIAVTHNSQHALVITTCIDRLEALPLGLPSEEKTSEEWLEEFGDKRAVMVWDIQSGKLVGSWCFSAESAGSGFSGDGFLQTFCLLHFPCIVVQDNNSLETETYLLQLANLDDARLPPTIVWSHRADSHARPVLVDLNRQDGGPLTVLDRPCRFTRDKGGYRTPDLDKRHVKLDVHLEHDVRALFFGRWSVDGCRRLRSRQRLSPEHGDFHATLQKVTASSPMELTGASKRTSTGKRCLPPEPLRFEWRNVGALIVGVVGNGRICVWTWHSGSLLWERTFQSMVIDDCVATARFVTVMMGVHVVSLLLQTGDVIKSVDITKHTRDNGVQDLTLDGTAGNMVMINEKTHASNWTRHQIFNETYDDTPMQGLTWEKKVLCYRLWPQDQNQSFRDERHREETTNKDGFQVPQDYNDHLVYTSTPSVHSSVSHGHVFTASPLNAPSSKRATDWSFVLSKY